MPLAQQICGVSRLAEFARQSRQRGIDGHCIVPNACLRRIPAGKHDRTRGRTYRLVSDRVREQRTTLCHGIEIGCIGRVVKSVGPDKVPAELVGKIKNNVWLLLLRLRHRPISASCLDFERCGNGYPCARGCGSCPQHELTSICGQCELPSNNLRPSIHPWNDLRSSLGRNHRYLHGESLTAISPGRRPAISMCGEELVQGFVDRSTWTTSLRELVRSSS